jgi:beta-phosphoglucomutase
MKHIVHIFIAVLTIFIGNAHSSIKAIIFDCDGTLIDNSNGFFLCWQHALKRQNYELTSDAFWHFMNQHELIGLFGADDVIVKFYCKVLGRDCGEEMMNDKRAFSAQLHARYHFPAIEPTLHFLHQLAEQKEHLGLKLGIASGGTRDHILRILRRLNVETYFDVIVAGAEDLIDYHDPEGTNKPKPYVYLYAAKMLGVDPQHCVAIEDSRTGVSSAVGAGCITVAVPNMRTMAHDLSHAHIKIESFRQMRPMDFLRMISQLSYSDE